VALIIKNLLRREFLSMKIAMLGQKKVPSRSGGIEVVVENLSTRMVKKGQKVTLYNRKEDKNNLKNYKGVKIITVPTIKKKGLAAVSASFFATLFASLNNFDVIHIHAEGPAFFCWLPKIFRKKVVVTIHGLDWQRDKWKSGLGSQFIKIGEKEAVKYANSIIVLSKNTQEYFRKKYNRSTILIPNGVNKPKIVLPDLIEKKWNLKKDDYILFLGRIVPEKEIKNLILAYKQINTNKRLVIAGGSSDTAVFYKKMEELASDDDRILFTGAVKGRILEELYSNSYLYVLPSNLEGMPLSLLEAMSYGNCVLTSDIPECKEVIENKGLTFKVGNIEDLKSKLYLLLNNQQLVYRLKKESKNYILNKYNWNKITDKTLEVYRENND